MSYLDELEKQKRLDELLQRRLNYFSLSIIHQKIYAYEFEKIKQEILFLKIDLQKYHDEPDVFDIEFNYVNDSEIIILLDFAEKNREIRWLRKLYWPANKNAKYIGIIIGEISDLRFKDMVLKKN